MVNGLGSERGKEPRTYLMSQKSFGRDAFTASAAAAADAAGCENLYCQFAVRCLSLEVRVECPLSEPE